MLVSELGEAERVIISCDGDGFLTLILLDVRHYSQDEVLIK
jgi:hypothetical protein